MYKKVLIAITLFVILCIKFGQGLECYEHDYCMGDACRNVANSTKQCAKEDSRCWKITSPAGTKRGCGDDKCKVQIDIGIFNTANVCCSTNLCNSSIQVQTTAIAIVLMSLIAFVCRWYLE